MINFFRKIRRNLANENQFFKYSRYAIGEIVLIMLGIFLALQLQNWNENRKKDEAFKLSMESLYNTINSDTETYKGSIHGLNNQVLTIDYILDNPDSLTGYIAPYALHFVQNTGTRLSTQSTYYAENLIYNFEDLEQVKISRQLTTYINAVSSFESQIDNRLIKIVEQHDIPYPKTDLKGANNGWIMNDSSYYSEEQIIRAEKLIKSEKFRTALRSIRTSTIWEKNTINVLLSEALSLTRAIKKYIPDVKIIYEDVGIIGTSIDGYDDEGAISTPMKQNELNQNLWEIDLNLKIGTVKFRCRDSWIQNWGGHEFPEGEAVYFGGDIPVSEAGTYHITLDVEKNRYHFKKTD